MQYYHALCFACPALAQWLLELAKLPTEITSSQIIEERTVLLTSDHRLVQEEDQKVFEQANRLKPPYTVDLIGWRLNKADPAECYSQCSAAWLAALIAEQGDTKFYPGEQVSFMDGKNRLYGTICQIRPKEYRPYLISVSPNEKLLVAGMLWQ
jgi:hypothetical protein